MAKTEKPKEPDYDSLIEDLIQKIDNEKSLFRPADVLWALRGFILVTVAILVIVIPIQYSPSFSFIDRLVIFFAALAVIVAIGQFEISSFEERLIATECRRALEKFTVSKDGKPLLKALLKMKYVNTEFSLSEIHKICPDMFTKEMLLKNLYEQPI